MDRLTELGSGRVLVAGDLILDRYWYGATRRISPEAPVPIVRIERREERVGGAANVAANSAGLGAHVMLTGALGEDEAGDALVRLCAVRGINMDFVRVPEFSTTVKLRVVSQHQQLIRVDFEEDDSTLNPTAILAAVERQVDDCDVVVVSDYAKGSVHRVEDIIHLAQKAEKPVVVDPKGTDFSRYGGASLITPNLKEFEAIVGSCRDEADIVARARHMCRQFDFGAVLVTRGEAGMSLIRLDQDPVHLQAVARDVYDVTGAGDTACAVTATALAAGYELAAAVAFANAAAGVVVGKLGAVSVTIDEIKEAMQLRRSATHGVVDRDKLLHEVAFAKRRGEKIVMTNGCFDLLHEGHIRYLNEAATLGDRLIVAVNTDASAGRLKGPDRPISSLQSRMMVLAALRAVDWVVPFDEDTPRALIAEVLPDFLVKGGDYENDAIAGADEVRAAGGAVTTLSYHREHSTTDLLQRVRGSSEGQT